MEIPILLSERLGAGFAPGNNMGYHYDIGYIKEDFDYPIDDYYYEKEENWVDGTHKVSGGDNPEFREQIYWGNIDDPFLAKYRGYYDFYHKRFHGQLSMLQWAYIDVFVQNGDELETIRIEETNSNSVIYGAFEGLRKWLEKTVSRPETNREAQPSGNQYIRIAARNVVWKKTEMEEIGPVEFEVAITEEEAETIREGMLGSEYYHPYEYGVWAKQAEALLAETFGPQNPLAHLHLNWAKGERQRMISGCRFLTQFDIKSKLQFLDSLGDTPPIREELLAGIEDCYIWRETWTRETGHLWEKYTLLKRTPSEEELDYADCSSDPFKLRKLTSKAIISLFNEYRTSQKQ